MPSSRTQDRPMGLGRKGERVANTPIRVLPPSRGGRTVGDHLSRTALENCQMSQRLSLIHIYYLIPGEEVILRLPGGSETDYRAVTEPILRGLPPGLRICPGHGEPYILTGKE